MNADTYGRPHGTCAHTGTDYDHLTGYVTGNYVSEWTDKHGTRWRTYTTVVNLGRPDRGTPVDPDAASKPEPMPYTGLSQSNLKAVEENRRLREERDLALVDEIRAVLEKNGPMTAIKIARRLGTRNSARALRVLRANPDLFVCHKGQVWTWALIEQPLILPKMPRQPSRTMLAIRAVLEQHGPQTATEIAERLGIDRTSAPKCLIAHPEWFCVVATREIAGLVPTRVWGLVQP